MTTKLRDAPGGAEFISTLTRSIRMMALEFAGAPDHLVRPHIARVIGNIEAELIKAVGPKSAAMLLDVFSRAVMGHKHDIEAARASGSLTKFLEVVKQ